MKKALENIRILDLSRVLAGPVCTQILGDLGAEVIKVERPGFGDDTRKWGPPFLHDDSGQDTSESSYYLAANRNKKSVSIDFTTEKGRELIKQLVAKSDVLIENYKTGGLEKYGLSYEQLKDEFPELIYCSITGFGQNGPLASEPGYDFLAQAMAGLMSITGDPQGEPMKVGVALSDVMTGLYAAISILASMNYREKTGKGQYIDLSLVDCTLAGMTNIAQYFLTTEQDPPRLGNSHASIVPYEAFAAKDGFVILAIGNDGQFARFAKFVDHEEWASDQRFSKNADRVINRDILLPLIKEIMKDHTVQYWIDKLVEIDVPIGPVNNMKQVFSMDQIKAREMKVDVEHSLTSRKISLVGSPIKLSESAVSYECGPPTLGQDNEKVLSDILGLELSEINQLKDEEII